MMRLVTSLGKLIALMALTEASTRGESVLVNMKPKTHDVWTGNIYSRSSGSTYYATMTLKSSGKFHVEACQVPRRSLPSSTSKPAHSATSGVPETTGGEPKSSRRK
ncbi:DUF2147 domain-containing protein [Bradyrhizobium sp. LB13.1]